MTQSAKFSYTLAALGQPFETLRGIRAKLLSYEPALEKPLIVQVGDQVYNYTIQGKRSRGANSTPLDLRMVVPKKFKIKRFVNVSYYPQDGENHVGVYLHPTHEAAVKACHGTEKVRIIAMPITVEIEDDKIKAYTPEGNVCTYKLNSSNPVDVVGNIVQSIAEIEGYKL